MKNAIIALLFLSTAKSAFADVKFVDFNKIDPTRQFAGQQRFLVDNLEYYDHWSPDWVYSISKDSLIRGLKGCLHVYEPLQTDPFERDLLLGEIAHYLNNLSEESYYDTAVAFYQRAIQLNTRDCRGYWFLGYHYAMSDRISEGVSAFQIAVKLVDDKTGIDFWQEYAFAMMTASKPFHARYALNRYQQGGGGSEMSKVFDSTLRRECNPADPDSSYADRTMWGTAERGKRVTFTSFPLGIRIDVDSNWKLSISDFGNRMATWIAKPPEVNARDGKRIGYTIALVAKVARDNERLEDFVAAMTSKIGGTRDSTFAYSGILPAGISYSYNDNAVYSDQGGARFRFIGIERPFPENPGLKLEDAGDAPDKLGDEGKLQFYRMGAVHSRFPGRVFYLFLLDTCGDIQAESTKGFRRMLEGVILE